MHTRQTGRRNFLGNMAVLSTGMLFGVRTSDIFLNEKDQPGKLEVLWKNFCEYNRGVVYVGDVIIDDHDPVSMCGGHQYKNGKPVYFTNENIVAQPIWIFWQEQSRPSDVVVILAEKSPGGQSVRINRFELETACKICEEGKHGSMLNILMRNKFSFVRTRIFNEKNVQLHAITDNKKYIFRTELSHHT